MACLDERHALALLRANLAMCLLTTPGLEYAAAAGDPPGRGGGRPRPGRPRRMISKQAVVWGRELGLTQRQFATVVGSGVTTVKALNQAFGLGTWPRLPCSRRGFVGVVAGLVRRAAEVGQPPRDAVAAA